MLVTFSASDPPLNDQVAVGLLVGGRVGVTSLVGIGVTIEAAQLVATSITSSTVYRLMLSLFTLVGPA